MTLTQQRQNLIQQFRQVKSPFVDTEMRLEAEESKKYDIMWQIYEFDKKNPAVINGLVREFLNSN